MTDQRPEFHSEATAIGRRYAASAVTDAAYEIGCLYASMLPQHWRAEHGIYFTPPALADRLLNLVTEAGFNWSTGRAIDPACGGGAFLAPLVSRLVAKLKQSRSPTSEIVEAVSDRIWGIELDPFLAWLSQVFVDLVLQEVLDKPPAALPSVVLIGDALAMEQRTSLGLFDLVVGNPPYGRVRLTKQLRREYAASLFGHANLYGLFTHFAVRKVRTGGIIGFVTPTSFLGGQYFKNLRRTLVQHCPPVDVEFITERSGVFRDALQETCLGVFRKQDRPLRAKVHFLQPSIDKSDYVVRKVGTFRCNGSPDGPWLLPRRPDQVRLIRAASEMRWRLRDYGYSISTGPLVWNRHKSQIYRGPGSGRMPLIWAESVRADGEFRFEYARRQHAAFFEYRSGQDHLVTRCECVVLQRTTAKEQHRRLIAAAISKSFVSKYGGMVVENHLNVLKPLFRSDRVPAQALATLLNCEIVDRLFRCISGSVAVSAYELESLPLPPPETIATISRMLEKGAPREAIEAAVAAAYGATR